MGFLHGWLSIWLGDTRNPQHRPLIDGYFFIKLLQPGFWDGDPGQYPPSAVHYSSEYRLIDTMPAS